MPGLLGKADRHCFGALLERLDLRAALQPATQLLRVITGGIFGVSSADCCSGKRAASNVAPKCSLHWCSDMFGDARCPAGGLCPRSREGIPAAPATTWSCQSQGICSNPKAGTPKTIQQPPVDGRRWTPLANGFALLLRVCHRLCAVASVASRP
jgi:hypothetical protein